jgi:hypothetical protein
MALVGTALHYRRSKALRGQGGVCGYSRVLRGTHLVLAVGTDDRRHCAAHTDAVHDGAAPSASAVRCSGWRSAATCRHLSRTCHCGRRHKRYFRTAGAAAAAALPQRSAAVPAQPRRSHLGHSHLGRSHLRHVLPLRSRAMPCHSIPFPRHICHVAERIVLHGRRAAPRFSGLRFTLLSGTGLSGTGLSGTGPPWSSLRLGRCRRTFRC